MRETGVIGNQFPNVSLNLVWCHQISPFMTTQFLNEWLDLVPADKIIAFGGDIAGFPEKTVGALSLARENLAAALAERVRRRYIGEEEAAGLCGKMLYDNPARIYGLEPGAEDLSRS